MKSLMRFLCTIAWRISEVAMTFAIRFDPDMPAAPAPPTADQVRASMLHAVDVHRSRAVNSAGGHGLN